MTINNDDVKNRINKHRYSSEGGSPPRTVDSSSAGMTVQSLFRTFSPFCDSL